jgi:hypothetical protein
MVQNGNSARMTINSQTYSKICFESGLIERCYRRYISNTLRHIYIVSGEAVESCHTFPVQMQKNQPDIQKIRSKVSPSRNCEHN